MTDIERLERKLDIILSRVQTCEAFLWAVKGKLWEPGTFNTAAFLQTDRQIRKDDQGRLEDEMPPREPWHPFSEN